MPRDFTRASWPSRRATLDLTGRERWYLVQSLVGREAGAEFQLAAQQYRVFLPSVTKTTRHARQFRVVRAPMFAGYLFVILDLSRDRWRPINGTFGVSRIVTWDDQPSPVPVGLVEAMLDRTDPSGETHFTHTYRPGDSVRIMEGPFSRLLGTLDRLGPDGRVRVLLEVMGGVVPVHLASDALAPAKMPVYRSDNDRNFEDRALVSD
jgi:transcriptional antiterminator RfaH